MHVSDETTIVNGKVWNTSDNSASWPYCMVGSDEYTTDNRKV